MIVLPLLGDPAVAVPPRRGKRWPLLDHPVKVLASSLLLVAALICGHHLKAEHWVSLPDLLGAVRDEVVPWLECTVTELLGPCPWVQSDQLSKFSDVKFYIGLAMWSLSWHVWLLSDFDHRHSVVGNLSLKWLMAMGFNLTALSCVQCDGASGFGWPLLMNCCNAWLVLVRFPAGQFPAKVQGEEDCRQYTAHSMFEDLGQSWCQILTIALSQLTLCAVVVYHNCAKYDPHSVTLSFWLLACTCVQIPAFLNRGSDSKVGRTWPLESFRALRRINGRVSYGDNRARYTDCDLQLRFSVGFAVNMFLRDVVIYLTPLVFMQVPDAMDLVVNALALTFLPKLDDLGEKGTMKIYRDPQSSWDELEKDVKNLADAAENSGQRTLAMVLTLSLPLAVWFFGLFHGLTLSPLPQAPWWWFWLASFWLNAALVMLVVHGRVFGTVVLAVAIPLAIWAFSFEGTSALASRSLFIQIGVCFIPPILFVFYLLLLQCVSNESD